ncbi:NAD(P)H-dependent oxidoreductase [Parvularcula marina]|uniref:NAD(P)H-dependent oxidoreductase n=1 Tax=Parvularcula marina TaxID=2292771 RepID=UPI003519858B
MADTKKICIIEGHPDPSPDRFSKALCHAYAEGAAKSGHELKHIRICDLDYGFLSSKEDFATEPPEVIRVEREKIAWADHLVIAFPLWLGSMPAKLRAFFEQAARADFFITSSEDNKGWPTQLMKGKSARILVSMGMPGLVYRFMMDEGALKALERAMLGLSGFHPIRHDILGNIDGMSDEDRQHWLDKVRHYGELAE